MPCHAPTMLFFSRPQHGRLSTAVLCCGLEKNGMVGTWHGKCELDTDALVNQMGKTHSKPLAARHGRGMAWARHGHSMLCVNRPLENRNFFCLSWESTQYCSCSISEKSTCYLWHCDRLLAEYFDFAVYCHSTTFHIHIYEQSTIQSRHLQRRYANHKRIKLPFFVVLTSVH